MESVGEDQEMKGSDWASAMRILTDMEHDQQHDGHDRCAAARYAIPRQPSEHMTLLCVLSCALAYPGDVVHG